VNAALHAPSSAKRVDRMQDPHQPALRTTATTLLRIERRRLAQRAWRLVLVALRSAALALSLGCRPLPQPPALPERPLADVRLPPSDLPGHGRVRLDVVGPPARLELVELRDYPWGTSASLAAESSGGLETTRGERVRPACERTPCVLDMPFGNYEFRFTQLDRVDTAFVTFGPVPTYAVHAVGSRRPDSPPWALVGGVLAATALIALPLGIGLAVTDPPPEVHQNPNDRRTTGIASATIGVAALIAAIACVSTGGELDRSGPIRQWPAVGTP
ncbi:MAG: hypothetical protein M3O46_12355, partial [Myxococcota bacterium]|nr:hypothetical protein [Myxococcota bacterium]